MLTHAKPCPFPQLVKRLPKRKRMTMCIGLLAGDGVVVAADAQESDQYIKSLYQNFSNLILLGEVA